ncbi:beta-propeller fold lactonase family protein [Aestuariibacter sp. A3R04]|uniref:lactonase family protein n=1 Tax=Aestuariibacter sp. A3R04 TaxID=2841571 RepID=UPI001C0A5BD7|nr:beta-propeller fold lactonase family protein [Aestuariibacter sp. A3R04]MBU3021491.1 lactonase family protein [Aestuariibacter sp. A3R04]
MKHCVHVFLGSYTSYIDDNLIGEGHGVYCAKLNLITGQLIQHDDVIIPNPSFLARGQNHPVIYAISEDKESAGPRVSALTRGKGDGYSVLSSQRIPGDYACHLAEFEGVLIVALYGTGALLAYEILAGGAIGPLRCVIRHSGHSVNPQRQGSPHPHQIYPLQTKGIFLVPDLGLDKVCAYSISQCRLIPQPGLDLNLPAGSGPRHLVDFDEGNRLLVLGELSACVYQYTWNGSRYILSGQLELEPDVTLPDHGASTIKRHPYKRLCYAGSRSENAIYTMALNQDDLVLTDVLYCDGCNPRDFSISPDGQWLVVGLLDSNEVHAYKLAEDGSLAMKPVVTSFISPACVVF